MERMLQVKVTLIIALLLISYVIPVAWLGLAFNYSYLEIRHIGIFFLFWFLISGSLIVCSGIKNNNLLLVVNNLPSWLVIILLYLYNLKIIYFFEVIVPYLLMTLFFIIVRKLIIRSKHPNVRRL